VNLAAMPMRAFGIAGCALLAIGVAGCDRSSLGRIVPVKGKVTFDGRPVTSGSLVFKPDAAKGNSNTLEPAGTIGPDGRYSLFTKEREGAPLGWYQVAVVAQEINEKDPYAPPKSLIPTRYNEASTSGLEIEVTVSPVPGAYELKLVK
jgi:hypothetical protein